MKLRDLDAWFSKYEVSNVDPTAWIDGVKYPNGIKTSYARVDALAEADGIWFMCPACESGAHRHRVLIGFAGRCPPGSYTQGSDGGDTRWNVSGTGLDDLTLTPSILMIGGCKWHGFVTNGDAA